MDTNSKKGSMTKAVTICLIAVGLVAGSSLLYGAIVGVYARQPFVGGAIVIGTSENQKISCSTGSSKNTHGLQFSAHTREGILKGYWDIASPFTGAENKGGYIYDGSSTGKTYELKGKGNTGRHMSRQSTQRHNHKRKMRQGCSDKLQNHRWTESYLHW